MIEDCDYCGLISSSTSGRATIHGYGDTEVEYAVVDGWAIFEGDILLGPVSELEHKEKRPKKEWSEQMRAIDGPVLLCRTRSRFRMIK